MSNCGCDSELKFVSYCIVFIHFYSASHSLILSEALPTTAIDTVGVYMPKRYRQLQVKDLPKVLTWRLERDSNPRPSGRTASSQPMRHHVPLVVQRVQVQHKWQHTQQISNISVTYSID